MTPATAPATATLSTIRCNTCRHWHQKKDPIGNAGEFGVGACHALPPIKNWEWPRTKGDDTCGCWTSREAPPTAPTSRPKRRVAAPE